jgi:MinD superfamily P-loop ATPase
MKESKPFSIAIASGKGGTGKTFISTHLAEAFRHKAPTLLLDLDVEEPNDKLFFTEQLEAHSKRYKMVPQWDESACTLCGDCTSNCKFHAVLQLGEMVAVLRNSVTLAMLAAIYAQVMPFR